MNVGELGAGERCPQAKSLGQAGPSNDFPACPFHARQRDIKTQQKHGSESNMRNRGIEMIRGDLCQGTDWLWSSFCTGSCRASRGSTAP